MADTAIFDGPIPLLRERGERMLVEMNTRGLGDGGRRIRAARNRRDEYHRTSGWIRGDAADRASFFARIMMETLTRRNWKPALWSCRASLLEYE